MSSNRALLWLGIGVFVNPLWGNAQRTDEFVSCPAKLTVTESAVAPEGWQLEVNPASQMLQRISIFQAAASGKQFDLAPDKTLHGARDVKQTWTIPHDVSLKVYLRCSYGPHATLTTELRRNVSQCQGTYGSGKTARLLSIRCK